MHFGLFCLLYVRVDVVSARNETLTHVGFFSPLSVAVS